MKQYAKTYGWIGIQVIAFLCLFLFVGICFAQIPAEAERYKRDLVRETRLSWGLNAPISTFASQIQAESAFRPNAVSPAGALGLSQFMPKTATWLSGVYSTLGPADPLNPRWAMRALAQYDKHLFDRMDGINDCEKFAFTLSAYNGGEVFLRRAIAACIIGCDAERWFDNVELINDGRAPSALVENRGYPKKILHTFEPRYVDAGWGAGMCNNTEEGAVVSALKWVWERSFGN